MLRLFKNKKTIKNAHLTVKEVIRETKDSITVVFEKPVFNMPYESGQFLTLISKINNKETRRAYSLCTSPFVDKYPAVTIKRVENGLMSNFLNDNLQAGHKVAVLPPMGNFITNYENSRKRSLVLFGGGSGITPLLSILKSVLIKEPASKVLLVYANRNEESIIFKEKLKKLESQYKGRFCVSHVLENVEGYLTQNLIEALVSKHTNIKLASYFICGPKPMMDLVTSSLLAFSVPDENIKKESFLNEEISDEQNLTNKKETVDRQVKVILDGTVFEVKVSSNRSILDSGLDMGIDMPYSCQSGLCTACRGKLKSGKVNMTSSDGLSDEQLAEGYVLTCQSHPETDDVVVEIG